MTGQDFPPNARNCDLARPGSPLRIEYSPAVLDQICNCAMEAARSLPAGGVGIGGLLLGERAGAQVRILESVELPCSHAFGPAFVLTPPERAKGRQVVETAAVVGWYCSRTHGELALTAGDLALYRELFPAEWQITLLLRADGEHVRAAFFFTNQTGELVKGAEHEVNEPEPLADPVFPLQPPAAPQPRRQSYLSWVLTAIAALAIGAAAFEIQNGWLATTPEPVPDARQAPSAQIP